MSRGIFGTDGARGQVGEWPITPEGAEQFGMAYAMSIGDRGDVLMIGHDTRESSPELATAIGRGVMAAGVNVELVGVAPTPALAYITEQSEAVGGVMVTASHNPYHDNGFKVFAKDGGKLTDQAEERLNELFESKLSKRGSLGKVHDGAHWIRKYEDYVAGVVDVDLHGQPIGLDMAHGATSGVAEAIFRKLGADVRPISNAPNGTNINKQCGATDTTALQEAVREDNLRWGAAFDGDGDRLIMVDALGRQVDGDYLMGMHAIAANEPGVVATHMSNKGLEDALHDYGSELHRVNVGDRYVLEGLRERGLNFGGEQSGHLIFRDRMPTGDGILAAAIIAKEVQASGCNLATWRSSLAQYMLPQQLTNVRAPKSVLEAAEVQEAIAAANEALGDGGRTYVRASGTEPKVRVLVEARDSDQAKKLARQIASSMVSAHTMVLMADS